MGAVILPAQSDPGDPFVDEPGKLPRADMIGMINPAREGVVVERGLSEQQRSPADGRHVLSQAAAYATSARHSANAAERLCL